MLKMADHGRSELCIVFAVSLCALEPKQTLCYFKSYCFGGYFKSYCFGIRYTGSEKLYEANL